jgi:hypothetical protein
MCHRECNHRARSHWPDEGGELSLESSRFRTRGSSWVSSRSKPCSSFTIMDRRLAQPKFASRSRKSSLSGRLTFISRTIRRWTLHHSSDKSLPNLAEIYNPCIRGWINYYSNFYRTQLRSTLKRIDPMSSAGRAANSNGCVSKPKEHATGLIGFAAQIRRSSLIGSCTMETAEHREPCESRGSRTDLGAPGG